MPGPALTVTVTGDVTQLQDALSKGAGGIQGFADKAVGLVDSFMGIKNLAGDAAEMLDFFVGLGGPEAQAAMGKLSEQLGTALAPVLEKLAPLIVKFIEGLSEILTAILPVLVPALQTAVDVLGFLFDGIGKLLEVIEPLLTPALAALQEILGTVFEAMGKVVEVVSGLMGVIGPLIDTALTPLWTALDSVRGMFNLVGTALNVVMGLIQPFIDAINNLLGPIGNVVSAVAGLLGDLGEAIGLSSDVEAAAQGLGNITHAGGSFGQPAGTMAGATVNVYTGADPAAVTRTIRRYAAANGGARSFARNVYGMRGH